MINHFNFGYSFLFLCLFIFSCSSDDDVTPVQENYDIHGIWKLAYLDDAGEVWNPSLICNGNSEMDLNFERNDNNTEMWGSSPCNSFYANIIELGTSTLELQNFGLTLTECQPSYLTPDCQMDGNEFESVLISILYYNWNSDDPIHYNIERVNDIDTLRIENNYHQKAVYWRNNQLN